VIRLIGLPTETERGGKERADGSKQTRQSEWGARILIGFWYGCWPRERERKEQTGQRGRKWRKEEVVWGGCTDYPYNRYYLAWCVTNDRTTNGLLTGPAQIHCPRYLILLIPQPWELIITLYPRSSSIQPLPLIHPFSTLYSKLSIAIYLYDDIREKDVQFKKDGSRANKSGSGSEGVRVRCTDYPYNRYSLALRVTTGPGPHTRGEVDIHILLIALIQIRQW